jgi:hypothetical protein
MDKLRNAWKSWTIRFNLLFGAVVTNFDTIRDSLPQIQPYMTPGLFGKMMVAAFVINLLLRFKTSTGLESK